MSSLNNFTDDFITTDRAFAADIVSCTTAITGTPITLTGNTTLDTSATADTNTWTTGGLCFNYDPRGWPWMCGKCHKIAFSTNQILNKFCSHDGWMVKLKAGMKI